MNANTTMPQEAFWSPAGPWEIVLLAAGALLTLVVVAFLIVVAVRAGREEPEQRMTNDE